MKYTCIWKVVVSLLEDLLKVGAVSRHYKVIQWAPWVAGDIFVFLLILIWFIIKTSNSSWFARATICNFREALILYDHALCVNLWNRSDQILLILTQISILRKFMYRLNSLYLIEQHALHVAHFYNFRPGFASCHIIYFIDLSKTATANSSLHKVPFAKNCILKLFDFRGDVI